MFQWKRKMQAFVHCFLGIGEVIFASNGDVHEVPNAEKRAIFCDTPFLGASPVG
jgi:hypothetical protein